MKPTDFGAQLYPYARTNPYRKALWEGIGGFRRENTKSEKVHDGVQL